MTSMTEKPVSNRTEVTCENDRDKNGDTPEVGIWPKDAKMGVQGSFRVF